MTTKRAYLVNLGLAKEGRGKFSNAAIVALDEAIAKGVVFDEPVKPEPKAKPVSLAKPAAPKPTPPKVAVITAPKVDVDPKAVRAWAKQNGHEVGDRGRINASVITAYVAAGGAPRVPTARRVPTPADMPKVRTEKVAWGFFRRNKGDGRHISEPLVAVESCAGCKKGISFCACSTGPVSPAYMGGEVLSLLKPVV